MQFDPLFGVTSLSSRDISSFPIPPSLKAKLLRFGFKVVSDFQDIGVVELSKELGISKDEALQILKIVKGDSNSGTEGKSALELLQKENGRNSIVTFNKAIDQMLVGGVPLGKITEFCGVPGIGKTQMGIQLAIGVHIPSIFDGVAGECIYIDTEGSFVVDRVLEIADATVEYISAMVQKKHNNKNKNKGGDENENIEEEKQALREFTTEKILGGIHYYRVHDYVEQTALVNLLPSLLSQPQFSKVRLIVMDSITFHFRHDFEDMALRTRLLNVMSQKLSFIAEHFNLAVVLINQMTTKVDKEYSNESTLVPALGETWGHSCTNRIILYWKEGQRFAHLYKSPLMKSDTVMFTVGSDGIR